MKMAKSKWQASQNGSIVSANQNGLMLMTLVLLLAFALGANGLNADVIWVDELYSVSNMGIFRSSIYSLPQIVVSLRQYSLAHVPLYFFLAGLWGQIAGWSQFSLRLMSCFFGVLAVAWLYRFAFDAVNRRTALVAALLMSTTTFVIFYFHEIRMYTMLIWLSIVHSWLYWRLAHRFRATRPTWFLFVVTASMLFYTHNFSTILFAGLGIHHLIFVNRTRRWWRLIAGWALGALFFLPYALFAVAELRFYQGYTTTSLTTLEVVELFASLLVNGFIWLWLPSLLTIGYALWRQREPVIPRLMIVALFMVAAILMINQQFNIITIRRLRYFLIVWWIIVILFAFGITAMPYWRITTGVFLLLWCTAGYQFDRTGEAIEYAGLMARVQHYPPFHEYVFHLLGKISSQDYLIGFSEEPQVNRVPSNRPNSIRDYYLNAQLGIDGVFLHTHNKQYRLARDVRDILGEHPHVLLAHDPSDVPANYIKALEIIQEYYIPCAVLVCEPDLRIQRYVHPVMDCDHQPVPIEYDNGIRAVDRFARYVPGSEAVQILTGWEVADEGLLDEYNVSLQIITADWQNVRQEDRHLYELPPWDVIELSTEGLPPGDYRLMMILYRRDTGEKVSGLDLTSGETGNLLPLLAFTIKPPG